MVGDGVEGLLGFHAVGRTVLGDVVPDGLDQGHARHVQVQRRVVGVGVGGVDELGDGGAPDPGPLEHVEHPQVVVRLRALVPRVPVQDRGHRALPVDDVPEEERLVLRSPVGGRAVLGDVHRQSRLPVGGQQVEVLLGGARRGQVLVHEGDEVEEVPVDVLERRRRVADVTPEDTPDQVLRVVEEGVQPGRRGGDVHGPGGDQQVVLRVGVDVRHPLVVLPLVEQPRGEEQVDRAHRHVDVGAVHAEPLGDPGRGDEVFEDLGAGAVHQPGLEPDVQPAFGDGGGRDLQAPGVAAVHGDRVGVQLVRDQADLLEHPRGAPHVT